MSRRNLKGARCLVTGASSGIGRSLARLLVRQGARVVLTGRSPSRLDQLVTDLQSAGAPADALLAIPADLTSHPDLLHLFEAVENHFTALDLVVNAAGVGAYGRFESHDPEILRKIIEINLFALAEVARHSHPLLRKGNRPLLVNIGSIVARRGLPGRSEYSASKFAVAGFTESLRAEWSYDGIDLLLVNPGWTATSFEDNLLIDTAFVKTVERRRLTPEYVADRVQRAMIKNRKEITISSAGKTLLAVNRLAPRFVDWALSRWTRRLYIKHRVDQLRQVAMKPSESRL